MLRNYHFFIIFLFFSKSIICVEPTEFRPLEEELTSEYESEDEFGYADEYPLCF